MNSFGLRLKKLRVERGLSQRQLATQISVEHTSIVRWENGLQDATSTNIIKLARFFSVTTDYLLGEVD